MPLRILIITIAVFIYLSILSPLAAFSASRWVVEGDALNIAESSETSLAATPHALNPFLTLNKNIPYVTWIEINSKGISLVYVKHRDGRKWVLDGGVLNMSASRHASSPTMASAGNNLYAAWSEADAEDVTQIHVKQWNGKAWIQKGGTLNINPVNRALNPVLSGNNSTLYLAWLEINTSGVSGLHVRLWDGASWRMPGSMLNKGRERHALTPSLAAGKDGVYLAWAEYDDRSISQVYVSHWNGKIWEPLGGTVNMDHEGHGLSPSISIRGANPYIAWMEYNIAGISRIYVKRWNGKEWVKLGGALNVDPGRHATSPSLAMKDDIPYVVWTEIDDNGIPHIYVKHLRSNAWIQDGVYLDDTADRTVAAASITTDGKTIYVAHSETDSNGIYQLYIKHLEGSSGAGTPQSPVELAQEASGFNKSGYSPTFFTSIPKDTGVTGILSPPIAYKYLPKTQFDGVDWMAGIREGILKPFDSIEPDAKTPFPPVNMDILLPIKKGFGIPDAVFPHLSHTNWLDCRNCHPTIFTPRRGGNPITMHRVLEREYCGRCHGVVAFRLYDCFRCHSVK